MNPADKYHIIQTLGQQKRRKFCDVFLVEHKESGQLAVLKSLRKSDSNRHLQERLRAEADFSFDHPLLPMTLDLVETEEELLLFKTYIEGKPLMDFVSGHKKKDLPLLLGELLRSFKATYILLQEQAIVHLDLKPSNLIVIEGDGILQVAIIDFGMAMKIGDTAPRSTLFPLGYAAPELLLNRLHLADHRTDQFALGISLWQCLTGKLPLLHPNPSITTNLQLTHPLPGDSAIANGLFPILSKMCAKHAFAMPPNRLNAAEKDKLLRSGMDRRYTSFAEVSADWDATARARNKWIFW